MRSSSRIYSKTNEGERVKPSLDEGRTGESYMCVICLSMAAASGVCDDGRCAGVVDNEKYTAPPNNIPMTIAEHGCRSSVIIGSLVPPRIC